MFATRSRSSPARREAWARVRDRAGAGGRRRRARLRDARADGGTTDAIRALGRRALPLQMDVTRGDEIDAAVGRGRARVRPHRHPGQQRGHRPAECGRGGHRGRLRRTLAVNLKGTFFVSQAVGRAMIRQRRRAIVNLGSQAGFVALPTESVYCMTKAAIAHLTNCLAVEWGGTASPSTRSRPPSSARRARLSGWRTTPSAPTCWRASRSAAWASPIDVAGGGRLPGLARGVADHGRDADDRRRLHRR